MKTVARAAWLLPSPAIKRQFEARDIPVPVRLPVWLHSEEQRGIRLVRLPAALAQGLGYSTSFFHVAESSLRPVQDLIVHSHAAHAVRRSSGCY